MNRLKLIALHGSVAVVLGYLTSRWLGLSFWICSGTSLAAMMVHAWLAAFEDDASGGFNHRLLSRKEPHL